MAFDRILIPTDLSDFATLAVKYGAYFEKTLKSTLSLLHVEDLSMPLEALEMPLGYYLEEAPASRLELMNKLSEQARAYAPGARAEMMVTTDIPWQGIVKTAKEMKSDLIIMGTHGRRGIERAFAGSVTERVLRHTDIPVLTLTPRLAPQDVVPSIKRILCPVNFTNVARTALTFSAQLANSFNAELIVMYVAEGGASPLFSRAGAELAAWIAPSVSDRLRYREVVTHGDAADRVLNTAVNLNADVIVIGSQHRFFSDTSIVGETTEKVARLSSVPVLTVTEKSVAPIDTTVDREAAVFA